MRLRWTYPAVADFTAICDYLEEHGSAELSRRIAVSVYERVGYLAKYPEFGRTGRVPETRELVFAGLPYLAIYRLNEDTIEILRILHGAQDWPEH
jgi:toxin ParE1/3/4